MISRRTLNTSLYLFNIQGYRFNIQGKFIFDGSIENLDCIIQHEEYKAITNTAVLENVSRC